ncbi:MAG: DNA primase [Planctomycetaceae bacterium]|nr:DNA primase [Planctomycetaceae bacterium]
MRNSDKLHNVKRVYQIAVSSPYEQNAVKERIRESTDIVELVGHYIPLKRAGRNYVGRCPWHDDTRPSLQVNPDRQTFKCWVCDIGGDVFAFVMKIENVDFREALEILADRAGIALPKQRFSNAAEDGGMELTKKQLVHVADWVAKLYHEELLHSDEAAVAREYLQNRNIGPEAVRKFRIGYAPLDRNWLVRTAQNKPERIKILEIIGNVRQAKSSSVDLMTQNSGSRFDFFRGRLIFPIRDEQGRTVAFGGRLIPNSPLSNDSWHKDRKYLNSPETTLFSKHKVLYGLDTAKQRIKETRRALIVEGYTDCMTAHEFGFGEAVAVLGTALGPDHIRLLDRMGAEKIILMLDGDKAGQTKAESNQVLIDFIAQGADMAVLTLPEGLDPCDFLEKYGAEALDALLQTEAVDALEHVFRAKTRNINLQTDIIGASKALDSILEIIAHAPLKGTKPDDPIRFRIEKTVQNLSMRFRMPEDVIRRRLKEKQSAVSSRQTIDDRRQTADGGRESESDLPERWSKESLPDLLERNMLELWIMDPTAIYAFWEHVLPEHLRSPITRMIYDQCSEMVEHENKPPTFENLMMAFDDPEMKNYLVELEASGYQKFFGDDDEMEINVTERWTEPEFKEKKDKLVTEIIAAYAQREADRKQQQELSKLRSTDLSEDEKTAQLLKLQKKLTEKELTEPQS